MKKYFVVSRLSDNMCETPEGFLLCLAVPIARTGAMTYGEGETPLETGKNGTIEIDRSPEEVFRPKTIASFEGKPITITHPQDFVNPSNWSGLAKGVVQNVRQGLGDQKDSLLADLLITDAVAINLVKSGLREVSCGYEAEYTQTGEGQGVQTNIVGNHVALVDEGRAGSEYAIKDHKGVTMDKKTLLEKMLAVVGITKDEAKKVLDADMDKDKDKDKDKSKDADDPTPPSLDALMKAVGDLNAMISGMANPTTAKDKDADKDADKDKDGKGQDDESGNGMEDRMKKLEAAVAQLLEHSAKSGAADEDPVVQDDDMDETGDDDMDGEGKDKECTGDTKSRAEILAPGLEVTGKDVKVKALKACYDTKDGKKLIEALNGGKAPAYDSKEKVDMLFTAASELLKASRNRDMTKTRQARDAELVDGTPQSRVMTPEKMNELNEKHYKRS